jgi:hypothetical protein
VRADIELRASQRMRNKSGFCAWRMVHGRLLVVLRVIGVWPLTMNEGPASNDCALQRALVECDQLTFDCAISNLGVIY